jgi:hypothetical protein
MGEGGDRSAGSMDRRGWGIGLLAQVKDRGLMGQGIFLGEAYLPLGEVSFLLLMLLLRMSKLMLLLLMLILMLLHP